MGKNKLEKTVIYEKEYSCVEAVTLSPVTSTLLARVASLGSPHDKLKVAAINADMGISDDPLDEKVTFGLGVVGAGAVSVTVDSVEEMEWTHTQNWRSIGTVGQVIQTMDHIQTEDVDVEMAYLPPVTELQLSILAYSNVASSVAVNGNITVEHRVRQFRMAGKRKSVVRFSAV